jgi:putative transposase
MPRANRHFLPGHVWHITHRCHQKKFLLKFTRDRRRYLHWVFEAKKHFGLSVLNYMVTSMVTSNHIHLLVKDTGQDVIAQSMQLIAGRTAQEYNERKGRHGVFWEDRYHATAIEANEHLHRCLVYIDLNMVRAGVVNHPERGRRADLRRSKSRPSVRP